jgi:hypothetical protein
MIWINSLVDLNRAAANALCPEPPASERRAIHESGCWRWAGKQLLRHCPTCFQSGVQCAQHAEAPHWEPADFCGDPVASKLLRDRMREALAGGYWRFDDLSGLVGGLGWRVMYSPIAGMAGVGEHASLETAMCLAALRALGVEFTLCEGWDAR